jgi:heat shock protein HslJ
MRKFILQAILGAGAVTVSTGLVLLRSPVTMAQTEPIWQWYNCLTREVFAPEKQTWCDRLSEQPHSPAYATMIPDPVAALEDTLWYLTDYRTADGEIQAAQTYLEPPSIRFSQGEVGGNATCNRFFSSYTLEGDLLSIQPGGSTLMACPEEFMVQEQAFLTALPQVASYRVTGDQLELLDAEGDVVLSFSEAVTPALTNTLWQLVAYNNGREAVVSVLAGTSITATFDGNGGITGFAGCNNYISSYTITNGAIAIGPGVSTRKFCAQPEGVMDQETEFLRALETADTYTIDGNTLILRTETGAIAAQFRATEVSLD